jgi:conjugal transfer pilus assembly protein TraW
MRNLLILFLLVCIPATTSAINLGVVGKTYQFAERDALAEVEERAKQVDWSKQMANLKRGVVEFRPGVPELPRVIANRVRRVDPAYTLDVDVPDPRDPSRVLYPKGFSFNPFQYMTLPGCVVFVDPSDKKQLAWLKKSSFVKEATVRILLTGGDVGQMEQMFARPFYFTDSILVERFDIMAVPSAACQKGTFLEIHEILP